MYFVCQLRFVIALLLYMPFIIYFVILALRLSVKPTEEVPSYTSGAHRTLIAPLRSSISRVLEVDLYTERGSLNKNEYIALEPTNIHSFLVISQLTC